MSWCEWNNCDIKYAWWNNEIHQYLSLLVTAERIIVRVYLQVNMQEVRTHSQNVTMDAVTYFLRNKYLNKILNFSKSTFSVFNTY